MAEDACGCPGRNLWLDHSHHIRVAERRVLEAARVWREEHGYIRPKWIEEETRLVSAVDHLDELLAEQKEKP
jgi:capsule polysaccharide modification protein KpsS